MILCCGEALIDFVPLPDQNGYRPCPGGSVFNIAVGLGRLQAPAGFFCKLSTDFFGDLLLDTLAENRVRTDLCLRAEGPTTLAFVSLPRHAGEEPRYLFYAHDTVDRLLTESELPDLPESVRALHFGSISLVLEPGASALTALMRRESGRRILSLDPNVRPGLIPDRAAYRRRFESWLGLVDILRLSDADFDFIYPDEKPEQRISRWFELGISLCLLTRGAEGAIGYTAAGQTAAVPAPDIPVVDTVGAGDTFLAAALAFLDERGKLHQKKQLRELPAAELASCLTYAARAAAINCSRRGADPPTKSDLENYHD